MDKIVEDRLTYIAIAYMEMLEGTSMILQVLEKGAKAAGKTLHQRAKQRNNRILFHLKALRQLTSDDPFENEHQVFSSNWLKYDDFRSDAAYFARLSLFLTDRTYKDDKFRILVEDFIKTKAPKGIIPDNLVNSLTIR
ncbi:MAG: hypothetical protein E7108_01770 [Bacteroidales bacterium]|nr:hypothetical protein [Bacteroidales bacterium]